MQDNYQVALEENLNQIGPPPNPVDVLYILFSGITRTPYTVIEPYFVS